MRSDPVVAYCTEARGEAGGARERGFQHLALEGGWDGTTRTAARY